MENLKGKYVVAYNTICDGDQCMMDEDNKPLLFDSEDEAFKEVFDGAYSMLSSRDDDELKEMYDGAITKKKIARMGEILDSGDVKKMRKFLNDNPDYNENEEWPEPADEFIMGRKAIFGNEGLKIIGEKL